MDETVTSVGAGHVLTLMSTNVGIHQAYELCPSVCMCIKHLGLVCSVVPTTGMFLSYAASSQAQGKMPLSPSPACRILGQGQRMRPLGALVFGEQ